MSDGHCGMAEKTRVLNEEQTHQSVRFDEKKRLQPAAHPAGVHGPHGPDPAMHPSDHGSLPVPREREGVGDGAVRARVRLLALPRAGPAPADALEALYRKHRALLLHIATHKFRVPEQEAEALIHDVFLSYMLRDTVVEN